MKGSSGRGACFETTQRSTIATRTKRRESMAQSHIINQRRNTDSDDSRSRRNATSNQSLESLHSFFHQAAEGVVDSPVQTADPCVMRITANRMGKTEQVPEFETQSLSQKSGVGHPRVDSPSIYPNIIPAPAFERTRLPQIPELSVEDLDHSHRSSLVEPSLEEVARISKDIYSDHLGRASTIEPDRPPRKSV